MRAEGIQTVFVSGLLLLFYPVTSRVSFAGGGLWRWLRLVSTKCFREQCGKNVNIETKAFFGSGRNIIVVRQPDSSGDYSL